MAALQVLAQQLLRLAAQAARLRLAWRARGVRQRGSSDAQEARQRTGGGEDEGAGLRLRRRAGRQRGAGRAAAGAAAAVGQRDRLQTLLKVGADVVRLRRSARETQSHVLPRAKAARSRIAAGAHRDENLLHLRLERLELLHVRALRGAAAPRQHVIADATTSACIVQQRRGGCGRRRAEVAVQRCAAAAVRARGTRARKASSSGSVPMT